MKKAALLSVSDRTGLIEFAKVLVECGYTLLATSGTTKALKEAGVPTLPIEEYTGQKEILDGRVKTLHPKIHGGLLAKRDNPEHMKQLEAEGILPIDIAVINLYPFIQNLSSENARVPAKMTELIDIGGPTMIRAAAKNYLHVLPVIDPADYADVGAYLKKSSLHGTASDSASDKELRRKLSVKVFTEIANYNLQIAKYISNVRFEEGAQGAIATVDLSDDLAMGDTAGIVLSRAQGLRYGENPHQTASFYSVVGEGKASWEQLNGKELSYNNLLDFDAALRLIRGLAGTSAAACIMKHLNPCGAARAGTLLEALHRSKRGDPRSHFGGVLAFSEEVTLEVAKAVREDFAEIVLAQSYSGEALTYLRENKNLRVLKVPVQSSGKPRHEFRVVEGGVLIQKEDLAISSIAEAPVVSERIPTEGEKRDLAFAWNVCAHVKSNAIVIAKDEMLLGVGAGQMSRIDSIELALSKANTHGHDLKNAVCASDAFFPFPDSIETLGKAGISAVVAPSGAKRDGESISAANKLGVALLFASDRHFRH